MEFKTPVNSKIVWVFAVILAGFVALNIYDHTISSFAIGGFSVPIMMYFSHRYTRYYLEKDELVIRQFLQKTKRIPYRDIYKLRKIDNPRTIKWMHGEYFPTIEVYYNKFDMVAILTGEYDTFFTELKSRIQEETTSAEASEVSVTV